MNKKFEPALYQLMKRKGFDLVPYVNHFGETPERGWTEFWDSPRYGSGYATLWNSFAFVPETHMLKPYRQRVEATKSLMQSFIEFTTANGKEIASLREQTKKLHQNQSTFPVAWKLDRSRSSPITYKGYEAVYRNSEITGQRRLFYDRTKPYEKTIPFYNFYRDTLSVSKPQAYIIPQGWWRVIERLQANNVKMRRLAQDTSVQVEAYRIENYQSSARPYEGHHANTNVQISKTVKVVKFRKGDYYIPMNQAANRFLIETLEPHAEDSYFTWNFFDPILGQKEGFSGYVFEETAAAYLKANPELKQKLEQRRAGDSAFAKNGNAQLDFIFRNSPFYEPAHMQYPVYRLMQK